MRRVVWTLVCCCSWLLLTSHPSRAHEDPDLAHYVELLDAVERAQSALRDATPSERAERREQAVAAHAELLAWLEEYVGTSAYAALDPDAGALVRRDLDTTAVSLTRLRAEAGDCQGAYAELDRAVARADTDERRAFVQATGADLAPCAAQSWFLLEVEPEDAEARLDGSDLGPATGRYRVAAGPHELVLWAPDHEGVELALEADPGAERTVGPLTLLPDGDARDVEAVEATLWAVGAVGIGVGVGYLVFAENRRAELEDLEAQGAVIIDRDGEVDTNHTLRLAGGITLGVGLAAAATGTVLYLTRRGLADASAAGLEILGGPDGFAVSWSAAF